MDKNLDKSYEPFQVSDETNNSLRKENGHTTKLIIASLIALAVIQVAVVIVLIYLGTRVGDLSSDVDDVQSSVEAAVSSNNCEFDNAHTCVNNTCSDTLIFSDNFKHFNITRWKHEITLGGGGNWEFQYYDNNRSNSYVKDGVLYIEPSFLIDDIGEGRLRGGYNLDLWGSQPANLCTGPQFYGCFRTSGAGGNILNPIRSARIRTAESFNFKYGRVEVKAQLPKGDWLWPAIWLLPTNNQYGTWPASGEIDIMESRGNGVDYPAGGVNTFGSTVHWGPFYGQDSFRMTHATKQAKNGSDFAQDFHTYGLIWNATYIGTYLDDPENTVLSVPINQTFWKLGNWSDTDLDNPWVNGGQNAPFDQEFYLIMNLAVGGVNGYFPDNMGNKPWHNSSRHAVNEFWNARNEWQPTWNGKDAAAALKIDSVKIWC